MEVCGFEREYISPPSWLRIPHKHVSDGAVHVMSKLSGGKEEGNGETTKIARGSMDRQALEQIKVT